MVVCLPTFALYPLSFGMALDRLKGRKISINAFLFSCVIPFGFCVSGRSKDDGDVNDDDENCKIVILEQEEELFDAESKGTRFLLILFN